MGGSIRFRNSRRILAAGAAALAGIGSSRADAALLIDVRITASSGGSIDNAKAWLPAGIGSTLTLGVFAHVSGTDGVNNETINSVYGLLNSIGDIRGNLSGGVFAPFTDSGSQNGSVVDWDSDGDLDIGLSPTSSSAAGKFFARNGTAGGYAALTPISSNSGEVQVGQFVFTVTDTIGTETTINFVRRSNNGANVAAAALWFEDGSTVAKNPTNSPFSVSAQGVVVAVIPEPSTLGLMAIGTLGLLARRRNTHS